MQPGNSGGPVLDFTGARLGVADSWIDGLVIASKIGAVPRNVNFAIRATVLANFLEAQGVNYDVADARPSPMDLVGIVDAARKFTVRPGHLAQLRRPQAPTPP